MKRCILTARSESRRQCNSARNSICFAMGRAREVLSGSAVGNADFIGGSYAFFDNGGERILDARTFSLLRHRYYSCDGLFQAGHWLSLCCMPLADAKGDYLDGSKTYKIVHCPHRYRSDNFGLSWSMTDRHAQCWRPIKSLPASIAPDKDIKKNASDGSVTVWFGPKAPAGQESNWVQTMPGKGWNSLLRLYAPLEPWFDKTWKPGDFERVD